MQNLAYDFRRFMKIGGFGLTIWISISKEIESIPKSESWSSVVNLYPHDILSDNIGIVWDLNEDKIKFRVKLAEKPFTRRLYKSYIAKM